MINAPFELPQEDNNPLDLIEDLSREKTWLYTRFDEETLDLVLPGQKTKYDASMEWQGEFSALVIAVIMPIKMQDEHMQVTAEALEKINQNLWLGHFDLSGQGKSATFRHTLLLRGVPANIAIDLIADIFDLAVAECNRFYSTFQLARLGDGRLHDDLHAAVLETVGEA